MTSKDLFNKWCEIQPSCNKHGFRLLRITSECIPELSLGLDASARRCLVLSVDPDTDIQFSDILRDNISLEYMPDAEIKYVVVKLTDDFFQDLFDDLIVSIYYTISEISDQPQQAKTLLQAFHKWSEFFVRGAAKRLSKEKVQGLIGELKVLQSLITEAPHYEINKTLLAWRGPYGKCADFILTGKDLEVKTILSGKSEVQISSEYQLDPDQGKSLELIVIKVDPDPQQGISLSGQLAIVKGMVHERHGDYSIILTALKQLGIDTGNITDYDNFRFVFTSSITFDAVDTEFPKLTKHNTPEAICEIGYSLKLYLLDEFIVGKNEYTGQRT